MTPKITSESSGLNTEQQKFFDNWFAIRENELKEFDDYKMGWQKAYEYKLKNGKLELEIKALKELK